MFEQRKSALGADIRILLVFFFFNPFDARPIKHVAARKWTQRPYSPKILFNFFLKKALTRASLVIHRFASCQISCISRHCFFFWLSLEVGENIWPKHCSPQVPAWWQSQPAREKEGESGRRRAGERERRTSRGSASSSETAVFDEEEGEEKDWPTPADAKRTNASTKAPDVATDETSAFVLFMQLFAAAGKPPLFPCRFDLLLH